MPYVAFQYQTTNHSFDNVKDFCDYLVDETPNNYGPFFNAYNEVSSMVNRDSGARFFSDSIEYENHTKPLPKNKCQKWAMSKYRKLMKIPKDGHQEYNFEHIASMEEVKFKGIEFKADKNEPVKKKMLTRREKYGKKFLDKMKKNGIIDQTEHEEAMNQLSTDPEELDEDKVEVALKKYYFFPVFDENYELLPPPKSGFQLLHKFLAKNWNGENSKFFEMYRMFHVIRQRRQDSDAVQFFCAVYDEMIQEDSDLMVNLSYNGRRYIDVVAAALVPLRNDDAIQAYKNRFFPAAIDVGDGDDDDDANADDDNGGGDAHGDASVHQSVAQSINFDVSKYTPKYKRVRNKKKAEEEFFVWRTNKIHKESSANEFYPTKKILFAILLVVFGLGVVSNFMRT